MGSNVNVDKFLLLILINGRVENCEIFATPIGGITILFIIDGDGDDNDENSCTGFDCGVTSNFCRYE